MSVTTTRAKPCGVVRVVAVAAVFGMLLASGCAKAAHIPNDHGGYTLMTKVGSMEDAITRFRRTAESVCGARPYTLSKPTIVTSGWGMFGSEIDVQSDLTCQ